MNGDLGHALVDQSPFDYAQLPIHRNPSHSQPTDSSHSSRPTSPSMQEKPLTSLPHFSATSATMSEEPGRQGSLPSESGTTPADALDSRLDRSSSPWRLAIQLAAYATGWAIVLPMEFERLFQARQTADPFAAWLSGFNIDTTLPGLVLLVAPFFWFPRNVILIRRRQKTRRRNATNPQNKHAVAMPTDRGGLGLSFLLATIVGVTSLAVSVGIGSTPARGPGASRLVDLPPAYHDEYSYLFQARTFLAGRTWFPSHAALPELFDQMHVLNEGRFASRYFPGTGLWMAPFVAIDHPYWGHWLAGAVVAMFVFGIGRELSGNGVGFLAGLLTALSPAMGLFSNALLAHHPTLVGLGLFVFTFLRFQRTLSARDAVLAGVGLSFAMLCRPMTAAGVGLPFGIWLVWWLYSGKLPPAGASFRRRLWLTSAVGLPVLSGLTILAAYNHSVTGKWSTTPYQIYTDTYTPRHVYGFNNVKRGERNLGPRVIDNYDTWAENLTPALAVENAKNRIVSSLQWTLGIVPLAMAGVVFVLAIGSMDPRWRLIGAGILSLHIVHIPYWYDGIMHFHYVFESGPLWCLVFATASGVLWQWWQVAGRTLMPIWWNGLIAAALLVTYTACDPLWSPSRITSGIQQLAFSRQKYAAFREMIEQEVVDRPALVLVEPDPADRHIEYITNDPDLSGPVLFGHYDPDKRKLADIVNTFPSRACYLFQPQDGRLLRIQRTKTPTR